MPKVDCNDLKFTLAIHPYLYNSSFMFVRPFNFALSGINHRSNFFSCNPSLLPKCVSIFDFFGAVRNCRCHCVTILRIRIPFLVSCFSSQSVLDAK